MKEAKASRALRRQPGWKPRWKRRVLQRRGQELGGEFQDVSLLVVSPKFELPGQVSKQAEASLHAEDQPQVFGRVEGVQPLLQLWIDPKRFLGRLLAEDVEAPFGVGVGHKRIKLVQNRFQFAPFFVQPVQG